MVSVLFRTRRTRQIACLSLLLAAGCTPEASKNYTRMHLQNQSDTVVTFLAIEVTEEALADAGNRLPKPLPPDSVYSAVLSRPGNYWVRTQVETEGYIVERIEGPVRVSRGVLDWRFEKVDGGPIYGDAVAGRPMVLAGAMPDSGGGGPDVFQE